MRVQSVGYKRAGQLETIDLIGSDSIKSGNCFTVINGENGTGKSAILRIISDAALGFEVSRQSNLFTRDISISISDQISRTIALSGTHSDRFPLNSGAELRSNSNRFDILQFYYFGPKQSGNYTSVFKASNTIAHSLLSEDQNPDLPGKQVIQVLRYLGFQPQVSLYLQLGNRFKNGVNNEYFQMLQATLRKLRSEISAPSKLSKTVDLSLRYADEIVGRRDLRTFFRKTQPEKHISFDLRAGRAGLAIYDDEFFEFIGQGSPVPLPQLIADLISFGVLTTKLSLFRRDSGEEVWLDQLSSGEWQLLYSLVNLSINVSDDSLVLIDEPENSLHPQWQAEYISLVRDLVAHRTGCHIIVATHSPLIAASVLPSDGNLVRLERSRDRSELNAKIEDNAYGWLPGDILKDRFNMDSVRPPELTKATNDALHLLKFSGEPSDELRAAAAKVKPFMENLPNHDPLLSVLNAIVEIASGRE